MSHTSSQCSSISLFSEVDFELFATYRNINQNLMQLSAQNNFSLLSESSENLHFAIRNPIQHLHDLRFLLHPTFKDSFLEIQLTCSHNELIKLIQSIGLKALMAQINDLNINQINGIKTFWNTQLNILSMRSALLILPSVQCFKIPLSRLISQLRSKMMNFVSSLLSNPNLDLPPLQEERKKKPLFSKNNQAFLKGLKVYLNSLLAQKTNQVVLFPRQAPKIDQKSKMIKLSEIPKSRFPILRVIQIESKVVNEACQKQFWAFKFVVPIICTCRVFSDLSVNKYSNQFKASSEQFDQQVNENVSPQNNQPEKGNPSPDNFSVSKDSDIKSPTYNRQIEDEFLRKGYLLIEKQKTVQNRVFFENQVSILSRMRNHYHRYIASYFVELIQKESEYTEFYLQQLPKTFEAYSDLSFANKLKSIIRIIYGVQSLNRVGIIHRDLKPANVLLSKEIQPKIIDFGSATTLYQEERQAIQLRTTRFYNIFYRNLPESIRSHLPQHQFENHRLFDVFSLGRMLEVVLLDTKSRNFIGEAPSEFLSYLSAKCCEPNPNLRPTYQSLLFCLNKFFSQLTLDS